MRVATMENVKQVAGICVTCNYLKDCLHRLNNGQVIWFCEQFDDFVPPKPRKLANPSRTTHNPHNPDGYMGLCVNCEHRAECIHAKTPGGIWHCEEYL